MKSALRDFILAHPYTWEEELAAAPYYLKISYDDKLVMFKYNQISSDFSLPIVREARGIIFDWSTWTCVCRAFDKFGNYGESYVPDIDWSTAFVSEKIDGSLMKVYWYDGEWRVATNGTINAFNAEVGDAAGHTFGGLFNMALCNDGQRSFFQKLDTNKCYMFELVSPYTKVVVPYSATELYFLGSRDLTTGQEYTFAEEPEIADYFNTPHIYPITSVQEASEAAAAMPWDEEGYVVCDANKNRCKIKSPAYVRAHYMRTNGVVTLKRLVSIIQTNEIEEFLIYAPEWREALQKVVLTIEGLSTIAIKSREHIVDNIQKFTNRKDYYDYVSNQVSNKYIQAFLLKLYNNISLTWEAYTERWDENYWTRFLEQEVVL